MDPFLQASIDGNTEAVRELLNTAANVPSLLAIQDEDGNTALLIASYEGHTEIVRILLAAGAKVDHANKYGLTALLLASQEGHTEIVQILLAADAKIDHTDKNGWTALMNASQDGHADIVRMLLEKGAKITPNLQELIDSGQLRPEIVALLIPQNEPEPWKGWSRADVSHFQTVFLDAVDANNNVVCPICLKYVSRTDGCMYMSHNCRTSGGFYHKELYKKYKDEQGNVEFCTICGRICHSHKHFDLTSPNGPKAPLFDGRVPNRDYFGNDCQNQGGGGIYEKAARYIAIRNKAAELNQRIGQITKKEALEQIVEAAWSAPIDPVRMSNAMTQVDAKKFNNIPFPHPSELEPQKNINLSTLPDIVPRPQDAVQPPLLHTYGTNIISQSRYVGAEEKGDEDNIQVNEKNSPQLIQFRHKDEEGKEHPHDVLISRESLVTYIKGSIGSMQAGEPQGGKCFCTARLYPQEIQGLVPADVYERYRMQFNYVFRVVDGGRKRLSGGNSLPFFTEITNGACLLPPGRSTKKGGKGWMSRKHRVATRTRQKSHKSQKRNKSHKSHKKTKRHTRRR